MLRLAVVLALIISPHLLAAGDRNADYGPLDIEVRLRDGSQTHGELMGPDTLKLKTAYGALSFPITEVRQIRFGVRVSEKDMRSIQEAIALLDNDDFGRRDEAQKTLETFGAGAMAPLKTALAASNSPEVRNRIDGVLKRLAKKDNTEQSDDQVSANGLDVTGELDLKEFRCKSPLGDLTVKIEDVESIRWLAGGRFKSLTLEAKKGLIAWIDSGLTVAPGESVSVSASGSITLLGYQSDPMGNKDFGTTPFMVGSLIGRIGKSGEPFLIGSGKKWTATERERLYLKIFCTDDQSRQLHRQPSTGSYRIRAATGVWVSEMDKPAGENNMEAPDDGKDALQQDVDIQEGQ
jgi:hypothetical protein